MRLGSCIHMRHVIVQSGNELTHASINLVSGSLLTAAASSPTLAPGTAYSSATCTIASAVCSLGTSKPYRRCNSAQIEVENFDLPPSAKSWNTVDSATDLAKISRSTKGLVNDLFLGRREPILLPVAFADSSVHFAPTAAPSGAKWSGTCLVRVNMPFELACEPLLCRGIA